MFNNILRTLSFCVGFVREALVVTHIYGGNHVNINATPQVLPQSGSTSEHMTTGSFENVTKQTKKGILSDEKREQINAKRRANYRRKKEEEAKKLEHESQAYLSTSGIIVWFLMKTMCIPALTTLTACVTPPIWPYTNHARKCVRSRSGTHGKISQHNSTT